MAVLFQSVQSPCVSHIHCLLTLPVGDKHGLYVTCMQIEDFITKGVHSKAHLNYKFGLFVL